MRGAAGPQGRDLLGNFLHGDRPARAGNRGDAAERAAPSRRGPVVSRARLQGLTSSVVSHKSLDFDCHSERSEESRLFKYMRPFTSFRVTRKKPFSASCYCKEPLGTL